jgi:hypothetical protein
MDARRMVPEADVPPIPRATTLGATPRALADRRQSIVFDLAFSTLTAPSTCVLTVSQNDQGLRWVAGTQNGFENAAHKKIVSKDTVTLLLMERQPAGLSASATQFEHNYHDTEVRVIILLKPDHHDIDIYAH